MHKITYADYHFKKLLRSSGFFAVIFSYKLQVRHPCWKFWEESAAVCGLTFQKSSYQAIYLRGTDYCTSSLRAGIKNQTADHTLRVRLGIWFLCQVCAGGNLAGSSALVLCISDRTTEVVAVFRSAGHWREFFYLKLPTRNGLFISKVVFRVKWKGVQREGYYQLYILI